MSCKSYNIPHFPDCPLENACGICKLLKNQVLDLEDYTIDPQQTIVTLKKIKDVNGNYIYPLGNTESAQINHNCYTAFLKSCSGTEEVKIIEYNANNGKITLERCIDQAKTHKAPIYLDLGLLSVNNYNKIVDILCELYLRYCSKHPECATQEKSGIGKASYIDPAEQGKCPTFVTTADPMWQALATKAEEQGTGVLTDLIKFLNSKATCDNQKNKDVLEEIVKKICGKTDCLLKLVNILCEVLEEEKFGNTTKGIKIKDRFLEADYGFKPLILHKNRNTGTITPSAENTYISPALAGASSNVLTEDLTGKGGEAGYKNYFLVDTKTINLPTAGSLQIFGYLSASHPYGLSYGLVNIKSGTVTLQSIILNPIDTTSLNRGDTYGNKSPIIFSLSLDTITSELQPGQHQITLEYHFILPPKVSTDKSTSVYAWDWQVVFIPT